jgi:adenosine deaminase
LLPPLIDPTLPLTELHRHLDGSLRIQTILDLGQEHHIPLPAWDVEGLRPYVQVTNPQPGVMAFIEKFHWPMAVLADSAACWRVAYENVEDARREGLDYIELRFSPWFMAEQNRLDAATVVEAVVDGVAAGERDFGIKVNLIGILSRTYGPAIASRELDALLTQSNAIIAIDLAGDEAHFPGHLFADHFRRAREAGWHATVHAGEIAGPESIWEAIHLLGAERIGHALHAPKDPKLMDYLAEHNIGVECCLTSNVQTSCMADYADHPLKTFVEHSIPASINTDDPGISGIDLLYEYTSAAPLAGLSEVQIHQVQMNALQTAFLSAEERQELQNSKTRFS